MQKEILIRKKELKNPTITHEEKLTMLSEVRNKKCIIPLPNLQPVASKEIKANNLKLIKRNKPIIFNKKRKIVVSEPLTYIRSDTGKTRHFTPAAQE